MTIWSRYPRRRVRRALVSVVICRMGDTRCAQRRELDRVLRANIANENGPFFEGLTKCMLYCCGKFDCIVGYIIES